MFTIEIYHKKHGEACGEYINVFACRYEQTREEELYEIAIYWNQLLKCNVTISVNGEHKYNINGGGFPRAMNSYYEDFFINMWANGRNKYPEIRYLP